MGIEEQWTSRMVGMQQQGAWMRWEKVLDRKVSWAKIWQTEPQHIKFMVQAEYDLLPSPDNFHRWGKGDFPACALYS